MDTLKIMIEKRLDTLVATSKDLDMYWSQLDEGDFDKMNEYYPEGISVSFDELVPQLEIWRDRIKAHFNK